jgi:predicted permease
MKEPPRRALFLLESWLPPEAAEAIAGDLVEEYRRAGRSRAWFWRQALSITWSYTLEAGLEEIHAAARSSWRRPRFAGGIVVLLALGIGANVAMFHWVEHVLHRPLPYPEPDRLVRVFQVKEGTRESLSPPNYFDLSKEQSAFEGIAGYWSPSVTLTGAGESEKLLAATVSHSLFEVLGVAPSIGRGFGADDDQPGAPRVVILGDGLFRRRFGGDPGIVGRDITLDAVSAKVIGVAPPGFSFPAPGTELWMPLRLPRERPDRDERSYRAYRILNVVGRLAEGSTLSTARAQAETISQRLEESFPDANLGFRFEVEELSEVEVGPLRTPLYLLWAAIAMVLLIVCANVGGLLLARSVDRESEIALRVALGASRSRLLRALLAEGLCLAVAGGALGCLLGYWLVEGSRTAAPFGLPGPGALALGGRFFLYVLALVVLVFLAFVSAPAFGLRGAVADSLRPRGAVDSRGTQARLFLVVGEIALASTLLVSSMLLIESYRALAGVERGYREESVYYGQVELPFSKYRESHRRARFFEELVEEVRRLPGVERASVSIGLPLDPRADFFVTRSAYSLEGRPEPRRGLAPEAALHVIGTELFETLGVTLRNGRGFDSRDDRDGASVMIVNDSFAARSWPGEDPLGNYVTHDLQLLPDDGPARRRVVGVVSDFRYYSIEGEPEPSMYIPHAQSPWPAMHLLVRASSGASSLQSSLREILRRLDGDVPVPALGELKAVTDAVLAPPRWRARLLSVFATCAALLAGVGLYGLVSSWVSRRTREIGLRIALGAGRREVVTLVVGQCLSIALAGGVLGLSFGLLAARWMASLLFGVSPVNPASYGLTGAALLGIAALASYVPARRAARLDPIAALRAE